MGHMRNLFNGEEEIKKKAENRELPGGRGLMDTPRDGCGGGRCGHPQER